MTADLLILAYSDIVRRRVLPALAAAGVARVDIAARRGGTIARPTGLSGADFADYAAALETSDAPLVWISTVNSLHADLIATALAAGRDVIVDKPATVDPATTLRLVDLARARGRLLAEATVFAWHPQVAAIRAAFAAAGCAPRAIVAAFGYPPLPPGTFRHDPALGGGAVLDLGPYAVALGRVFFGGAPERVSCEMLPGDRGFGVLLRYRGDRIVSGQFGTGAAYVNRATLIGREMVVDVERPFTTAADAPPAIAARCRNAPWPIEAPAADSFRIFLDAVFEARRTGDVERFRADMACDARALAMLAQAASTSR